ncbi:hypothetical protein QPK13_00885 [Photorhabdus tasmaniensis]|uniref:hypothetical protein n=1 Tax=Photorhabdus sp. RM323S TaxID=3342828 RepID=UPI0036DB3D7D
MAGAALGAVTGGLGNNANSGKTTTSSSPKGSADNKGTNSAKGQQGKARNDGSKTLNTRIVKHADGKFEIKSLPDMHGKAAGDLDALKKEYNTLKELRIQNQKEFAKNPENKANLSILEKKIHNFTTLSVLRK